jgi:uncharacterized membrane protein
VKAGVASRPLASWVAGAVLILVLLAAPPLAHLSLIMHDGMAFAGGLIAVQAVAVTWILSASIAGRVARVLACGLVFLLALGLWRFSDGGPVVASAVPHAMVYIGLLVLFATSLEPGRDSIVTILARRSRGPLPPDILRYTRRVTWVWCGFFVAQLAGSALLLAFAPLPVWSTFVNLCNLPLVVALLGLEFAYRQWRHVADPPERLIDMVRIYRRIPTAPIREER